MSPKPSKDSWPRWWQRSAGGIFAITGIAKVGSALGNAGILQSADPILHWQFGNLMLIAAVIELVVAVICIVGNSEVLASILVAWLATNLLAYRLILWWMDWHRPCSCLGNLTDAIHISPQLADNVMKGVLAYLLIGSYGTLFWLWRQQKEVSASMSA